MLLKLQSFLEFNQAVLAPKPNQGADENKAEQRVKDQAFKPDTNRRETSEC